MLFGSVKDVRWLPVSYPKDTVAHPRLICFNQFVFSNELLMKNLQKKENENPQPCGREDVAHENPFHPMRPAC
jgi:hypothetical protein